MRRALVPVAAAAALSLLAAAPAGAATQWPQFRGNAQGTGQSGATGPTRPTPVRGFPFRAAGTVSSPVVANNGTVVLGAGPYLYGVSPAGKQLWRYYGGEGVTFTTAPAVTSGGTVYAIAGQANGAVLTETNLIALTPQGQLKWSEEVGTSASGPSPVNVTLGPDGTIYAAGPNNEGLGGWTLQAFNATGDQTWQAKFPGPISAPVIDPGTGNIYVVEAPESGPFATSGLYAVQPGGSPVWTASAVDGQQATVGPDGSVYVAGEGVVGYSSSGAFLFNVSIGEGTAGPTTLTPGGLVVEPTVGAVVLLNPSTQAETTISLPGATQTGSTPINDAAGNLFLGAGRVFVAATPAGRILWRARTGAALNAPAMAANGTVYVPDGRLLRAYGPGS